MTSPPKPDLSKGIRGHGMHDFVIREFEIGWRAAVSEDSEFCGFGPLFDAIYIEYEVNRREMPMR